MSKSARQMRPPAREASARIAAPESKPPFAGHSEALRAADVDRARVAERLRRAHDEGRLDLLEYDERLAAAYAARTYGDLAALTADLPAEPAPAHETRARVGIPARRAAVTAWASASALNLLIWAVVCLATGAWVYPWWIWVAGPWGGILLAGAVGARAAGR